MYQQMADTGRIDAFRLDWKPGSPTRRTSSGTRTWPSGSRPPPTPWPPTPTRRWKRLLDEVIALIAAAQQPDGYLNTHFTVVEPEKRWTNLRDCHELYCAGHLIEAAVAHFQATGKRSCWTSLCRYADHIDSVFGPRAGPEARLPRPRGDRAGAGQAVPATGEQRYLRAGAVLRRRARPRSRTTSTSRRRARGEDPANYWARTYEYSQAHLPVREQTTAVGHAVRAMYLYSGMADLAAETGDAALLAACRRLWRQRDPAADVRHRRHRLRSAQRGLHPRLRPAQRDRLRRDLRRHRPGVLGRTACCSSTRTGATPT